MLGKIVIKAIHPIKFIITSTLSYHCNLKLVPMADILVTTRGHDKLTTLHTYILCCAHVMLT